MKIFGRYFVWAASIPVVFGLSSGFVLPGMTERIWVFSLATMTFIGGFEPSLVIRHLIPGMCLCIMGLFFNGFPGIVLLILSASTTCLSHLVWSCLQGKRNVEEHLGSMFLSGVFSLFAGLCFYFKKEGYVGSGYLFAALVFFSMVEFPFKSLISSIDIFNAATKRWVELFFTFVLVGTIGFFLNVEETASVEWVLLFFVFLASLTGETQKLLATIWIYLFSNDSAMLATGGVLGVMSLSGGLTAWLGPAMVALALLVRSNVPETQEYLILFTVIGLITGRAFVLKPYVWTEKHRELLVGGASIVLFFVSLFLMENQIYSRLDGITMERVFVVMTVPTASILFYYVGKKWPKLLYVWSPIMIWPFVIQKTRSENTIKVRGYRERTDFGDSEGAFGEFLSNERNQLLVWICGVVLLIWSSMWLGS